jgi:CHAT domain-containing protein
MGRSIRRRAVAAALSCYVVVSCSSPPPKVSPAPTLEELYSASVTELRRGDFAAALANVDRAIDATKEPRDSEAAGRFSLLKAEIFLYRRDQTSAREILAAQFPDTPSFAAHRARQLFLTGQLELNEGRIDAAIERFEQASRLGEVAGDVEIDAKVLQGQAFVRSGRWDEAERVLDDAISLAEKRQDRFRQASALHNLGMSHLLRSRFDAALPYFERVLSFNEFDSYTLHATALTNAAMCSARLGEFDRAVTALQRAVRMHEERGASRYLQQALGELGNTYLLSGRLEDGIPYLLRAVQVAKESQVTQDTAIWTASLATAYIELQNWDSAAVYNAEARRLRGDRRNLPYQIVNDAQIAEGRGQAAQAETIYREAAAAGKDDPIVQRLVHAGLGRLDLAAGRTQAAIRRYETALGIVEQTRSDVSRTEYKFSIQTRLLRFYREYVDTLVARGQPEQALVVADLSRGRVLAERQGVAAPARRPQAAFTTTAGRLQAVLVFYWIGPERSYAWVVTERAIRLVALATTEEEIALRVRDYQRGIVESLVDPIASSTTGDQLYATLIAPLSQWIPRNSRVVIVPDGPLNTLNFETLPVPGEHRHYWIEDVEIAVAPSLSALSVRPSPSSSAERSVLLIGDPVPTDPKFPSLKYASAEMKAVSGAFASRAAVYSAAQATPAQYLASQPARFDIVHFTAHAEANAESPLDSAVILSRDSGGYKLYARDVAERPLSADLVTISACRSAGERTYDGEGLVGFAWAFLRAGARRVIAGLWDVDDRSTAAMMGQVYANLAGGASPSEALRAAKLEMIRSGTVTAKPYYWAPFQLFVGSQVVP